MLFHVQPDKCVGCLACLRVCPVDAIAVEEEKARIVEEACVKCGLCVPACPHDAIVARGNVLEARALAARGDAVLILSGEAAVHFYPHSPEQVVNACYRAGFRAVHRAVLGDELVAAGYVELLADSSWGTMIRSTCPVVVEKIRREYPELVPYLAPISTPLAAETAYLRAMYGQDVALVYCGVCLSEGDKVVDATITFVELEELLVSRGVSVADQPDFFDRIPEERRRHIGTAGGMPLSVLREQSQASGRFRKVRGLSQLPGIARAAGVDGMDLGFVDILPCEGCLDHPLLGPKEELYWRRKIVSESEAPRSSLPVLDPALRIPVEASFTFIQNGLGPTELEVQAVIDAIGVAPTGQPWDCGACGFGSCRDFAKAQVAGRADFRQCPPYQERRAFEALREAAIDGLTGLATYRVLKDRIKQEMARSNRSREPFGVLFIDLDKFKRLNDQYGHSRGSEVLAAVGHELSRVVRGTDVAARYGGDEFAVLLIRTDRAGARRVAEAIRQHIEALGASLGYPAEFVSASVGVAEYDPERQEGGDPLEEADKAMYRAKGGGGNVVM